LISGSATSSAAASRSAEANSSCMFLSLRQAAKVASSTVPAGGPESLRSSTAFRSVLSLSRLLILLPSGLKMSGRCP
jgi:hypothetical protein